jgi:hypothetical protein
MAELRIFVNFPTAILISFAMEVLVELRRAQERECTMITFKFGNNCE